MGEKHQLGNRGKLVARGGLNLYWICSQYLTDSRTVKHHDRATKSLSDAVLTPARGDLKCTSLAHSGLPKCVEISRGCRLLQVVQALGETRLMPDGVQVPGWMEEQLREGIPSSGAETHQIERRWSSTEPA